MEAKAGGTCIVRVVHSLFTSRDDWDNQLEGTEHGWPGFFRTLRIYLTHFRGQRSAIMPPSAAKTGSAARKLGINAAQTMNRIVRNRMYNVAESGHTVADGAQVAVTSLRVKRLNGFTKARSASGSVVRFNDVSSANPLTINVEGVGTRSVIGFTPPVRPAPLFAVASATSAALLVKTFSCMTVRPSLVVRIFRSTSRICKGASFGR